MISPAPFSRVFRSRVVHRRRGFAFGNATGSRTVFVTRYVLGCGWRKEGWSACRVTNVCVQRRLRNDSSPESRYCGRTGVATSGASWNWHSVYGCVSCALMYPVLNYPFVRISSTSSHVFFSFFFFFFWIDNLLQNSKITVVAVAATTSFVFFFYYFVFMWN